MLIIHGLVHTALEPMPQQLDLRCQDGIITELGPQLTPMTGEDLLDASGLHLFPGLIDAHSHLGLDGYGLGGTGCDLNEVNELITPELDAIDAINPMDQAFSLARQGGVTCVATGPGSANVIGGTFAAIKTAGTRVDHMIVKRKVAMKCAFGENPKNVHGGKSDATRMTTAAKLRETLFKAQEYKRKKEAAARDPGKSVDFNYKLEALLPVLNRDIPLKAHAHQANDIFTAIRIAKEFNLKLTLEHCTEGHLIAEELAKEGFPVAVGPSLSYATKIETRNRTFKTPGILDQAGCKVSIITDSGVIPQEYLGLLAGLAVQSGMDPFHALQAITIRPAEHLGIAQRVGSLAVGKDADIVLCDDSIMSASSHVLRVFINGIQVLG